MVLRQVLAPAECRITQDEGELQLADNRNPGKAEIQVLVKAGLAKIDEDGISFRMSWTHEEVDNALRELFPMAFAYLDALESPGPDDELYGVPQWMLCVPENRRLRLVPEFRPNGANLHFNKGTTRAGYRESKIFIGVSYN